MYIAFSTATNCTGCPILTKAGANAHSFLRRMMVDNDVSAFRDATKGYINDGTLCTIDWTIPNDGKDETLLEFAIKNNHSTYVNIICEEFGADVNRVNRVYEYIPLHFAVRHASQEVLANLLRRSRADPNVDLGYGTPLHIAVRQNRCSFCWKTERACKFLIFAV